MALNFDQIGFEEGGNSLDIATRSGTGGGTANFAVDFDDHGVWFDEPQGGVTTRKFVPWENVASIQQQL